MKRVIGIAVCFLILFSCVLPARASGGVPQEVMEATKSVVRILSEYKKGASTGSGFVIKNDGKEVLVATNNHVVEDDPQRISIWVGENRQVEAQIVFTIPAKDLCVLRLTEAVDMEPLTLSEEEAQHGEAIYAVGYPGVADILSDTEAHTSESATITDGIISAIRTLTIEEGAKPVKLLQINAAINPGNSGGPLFNTKGEVIGVNTYGIKGESQGVFGSVDISELWNLLEEHNIDIVEETLPTEVPETTEPIPVEEPEKTPSFLLILIGSGAVILILVIVLIAGRRRNKTAKVSAEQKAQTTTLKEYIAAYPQGLGITGAVSLLLPVAVRLRNLHNDGKLHLQVCPENILVGTGGTSLSEPTQQETGRYNSGFAAPEIYKGAGFGVTSDIYSFAAVLLYAVTGKVPGNSLQSDALEQDFSLLEDAAFAAMIRKAMAFGVQDRTQSMQELVYGVAGYNAPVQPKKTVAVEPAAAQRTAPVMEVQTEAGKPQKNTTPTKKVSKLVPIAAVLACGILAVVLLWKPAAEPVEHPDETVTMHNTEQVEPTDPMTPEGAAYAEAEKLLADGETAKAAIVFGKLGDYADARERSFELWDEIAVRDTISATNGCGTAGLRNDGTVLLVGNWPHMNSSVQHWRNMKNEAENWTDIIAISLGSSLLGLKTDGTVIAADGYSEVEDWQNIVAISASGSGAAFGLKMDGTVMSTIPNSRFSWVNQVSDWTDIVAISASTWCVVGLRADGTVVAAGASEDEEYWNGVESWQDIVAIATGDFHTLGIKSDGTVVSAGTNQDGQCDVSSWTDIVTISTCHSHTVGIRSDGSLVTAGSNRDGGCSIVHRDGWDAVVDIAVADYFTIGLRNDGLVIAVGNNEYGQCNVGGWEDIKLPN